MRRRTTSLLVIFLVLAAGVLRLALVNTTDVRHLMSGDAYEYYRLSLNLKRCGVFTSSFEMLTRGCDAEARHDFGRAPGYPVMIMPLVAWPPSPTMLRQLQALNVVFGCLSVALVFLVFRHVSQPGAILAASLTAISPHLVATSLSPLTEAAFTLGLCLLMLCVLVWANSRHWAAAFVVGVCIGLITYIRPTTTYLVLAMAPFVWFSARRHKLGCACAVIVGFVVSFGPWMWQSRGYATDAGSGSLMVNSIHNGTYPDLTVPGVPESRGKPHRFDPGYAERDTLTAVLAHVLDQIRERPAETLRWYAVGKTTMFFGWDVVAGFGDVFVYPVRFHGYATNTQLAWTHWLMWHLHGPLHIAALIACVVAWRRAPANDAAGGLLLKGCTIIIAYFVAVHIVATPLPRYSVPLRPLVYALAGCLIATLAIRGYGHLAAAPKPGTRR